MGSITQTHALVVMVDWDGPSEDYSYALRLRQGMSARLLRGDSSGWVLVEILDVEDTCSKMQGWAPPDFFTVKEPSGALAHCWAPRSSMPEPGDWLMPNRENLVRVKSLSGTGAGSFLCENLRAKIGAYDHLDSFRISTGSSDGSATSETTNEDVIMVLLESVRPCLFVESLGSSAVHFLEAMASAGGYNMALHCLFAHRFNEIDAMKAICKYCQETSLQPLPSSHNLCFFRAPLELDEEEFVLLWEDAVNFRGEWARSPSGVMWQDGNAIAYFWDSSKELILMDKCLQAPLVWFFCKLARGRVSIWDPWLEPVLLKPRPNLLDWTRFGRGAAGAFVGGDGDAWLSRLAVFDAGIRDFGRHEIECLVDEPANETSLIQTRELQHLSSILKSCRVGSAICVSGHLYPASGRDDFGTMIFRGFAEGDADPRIQIKSGMLSRMVFSRLRPAVFGVRGMDGERFDLHVRSASECKAQQIGFGGGRPPWLHHTLRSADEDVPFMEEIRKALTPQFKSIRADLYKLVGYTRGDHFAPHVDTARGRSHWGTLVLFLPPCNGGRGRHGHWCEGGEESRLEGGDLCITHDGKEYTFPNPNLDDACHRDAVPNVQWVAFFSTCVHSVSEVTRGSRLSLVYNIFAEEDHESDEETSSNIVAASNFPLTRQPSQGDLKQALQAVLSAQNIPTRPLCVVLGHEYPVSASLENLLGADRMLLDVAEELHLQVKLQPLVLEQFYLQDKMIFADDEAGMVCIAFRRPIEKRRVGDAGHAFTGPSPMNVTLIAVERQPVPDDDTELEDRYIGNSGELPYLQYSTMALLIMHPLIAEKSWQRCRNVFLAAAKGGRETLLRRLQVQKPDLVKLVAEFIAAPRGKVLRLPDQLK